MDAKEKDIALKAALHDGYSALIARVSTSQSIALLQIGMENTHLIVGNAPKPELFFELAIGSHRTARDHFRHIPPAPIELENAIATVEDEVMRARAITSLHSTLFTTDQLIRDIARRAGVGDSSTMTLTLDAVEHTFERLVVESQGQAHSQDKISQDNQFAATLLILREFMHHLQFSSITIIAESWITDN